MNEEKDIVRQEKSVKVRLKLTFSILILAAMFIVELYLMMNFSDDFLLIGLVGLAILCCVYMIIDFSFKMQNEADALREMEYESIYKGEKVNYILMKQGFLDLEEIIKENRAKVDFPVDDLISAQKAVGKVTIQRGKENTTAILNSNEKLMDCIITFEDKLDEISRSLRDSQKDTIDPQEIVSALQGGLSETKDSVQEVISELSDTIRSQIHTIPSSVSEISAGIDDVKNLIEAVDEKAAAIDEIRKFTEIVDKKASAFDEMKKLIASVEPKPLEPSVREERSIPPVYEKPYMEKMPEINPLPDKMPMMEDSVPIPEPMPEPAVAKAPPIMEDSFQMPDLGMEESKETQDFTEPEPVFSEEPIPIPEPVSPEPVLPIEPANIPKPAVEEPSPLPNMADPGHVMTPEEIASLLANM